MTHGCFICSSLGLLDYFTRHCEERSDRSNPFFLSVASIASLRSQ